MNLNYLSSNLINTVDSWIRDSYQVGMAVLISASGSSPMPMGSMMVVNSQGANLGSVSGGCVEPAVIESILEMIKTVDIKKKSSRNVQRKSTEVTKYQQKSEVCEPKIDSFSYTDDEAFNFGLTCGGTVEILIFVPEWDVYLPVFKRALNAKSAYAVIDIENGQVGQIVEIDEGRMVAVSSLNPDPVQVDLHDSEDLSFKGDYLINLTDELRRSDCKVGMVLSDMSRLNSIIFNQNKTIDTGDNRKSDFKADNKVDSTSLNEQDIQRKKFFFYRFDRMPKLVIVGVSDHVVALSQVGILMNFDVIVVDPREVFLNRSRFPKEVKLVTKWPDQYLLEMKNIIKPIDSLCVLSHDEKFDISTLKLAIDLPFFYIGAMGSRVTTEKRIQKLRDLKIDEIKVKKIHSPIGLDIGANNSKEIALSIIAEIVAEKNSRSGEHLYATHGKITAQR